MSEQSIKGTAQSEGSRLYERLFSLEKDYDRKIAALNQTEILTLLPRSASLGVIGIDGKEYPAPAKEKVLEVFTHNEELVDRKMQQGFTQLQLTPMAIPTSRLIDRVKSAVLRHAEAGKIIKTKQSPTDADSPVRVNVDKPLWMWDMVHQAVDTPDLVYFPQAYLDRNHQGLTKEEVMKKNRLCAVPGWSVGLIEPIPVMPEQGQGKIIGGRKQLEAHSTPHDYLRTLSAPGYQGETGWTPEDFLTHFAVHLEAANQVSHDRYDSNALWLLGSYLPNSGFGLMSDTGRTWKVRNLVPVGYWARTRVEVSAHRSGNRIKGWVARSMVRLGT